MPTCSRNPEPPIKLTASDPNPDPTQVFPEPWTLAGKEDDGRQRASARASNWERSIGAFLASDALFAATPDHESPVNTGVWLAKPREWLFRAAIKCLHNCSWDAERGFNSISRPHRIAKNAPLLRRLAAGVGDGSVNNALPGKTPTPDFSWPQAFKLVMRQMQNTRFYKQNTWFFVCGNLDQGLFFYLIYLRYGVGTWSSPFVREPESVWVDHYWGHGKPWNQPGGNAQQVRRTVQLAFVHASARAYRSVLAQPPNAQSRVHSTILASSVAQVYLKRAIAAGTLSSVGDGAPTKCQQHLTTLWEKLVEKGLENKSDAGFSPYPHAVLPDYRSMRTFYTSTRSGDGLRKTSASRRRRPTGA